MRVHIIQHESFEAPAAYLAWARARGHDVCICRLWEGDTLPEADGLDLLLIMGGPQSPATTTSECPHFDAPAEEALIRAARDTGKAVVGVCLGAQLIADALGAGFTRSPEREVGVVEATLTPEGRRDALLAGFPTRFATGSWHGDMPGLTDDAVVLAESAGCPRQIVRFDRLTYALQCHLEFDVPTIQALVDSNPTDVAQAGALPFVQEARTMLTYDYGPMHALLWGFLDRLQQRLEG